LCYTADDYAAVIALMADGHYDTTGWVDTIAMGNVVEDGYEPLHAGQKMKLLVDPSR
jgi:(R,R)-butanediol dehydrogenase/meso-butanediol dehydrogenase/diacetyl reductase